MIDTRALYDPSSTLTEAARRFHCPDRGDWECHVCREVSTFNTAMTDGGTDDEPFITESPQGNHGDHCPVGILEALRLRVDLLAPGNDDPETCHLLGTPEGMAVEGAAFVDAQTYSALADQNRRNGWPEVSPRPRYNEDPTLSVEAPAWVVERFESAFHDAVMARNAKRAEARGGKTRDDAAKVRREGLAALAQLAPSLRLEALQRKAQDLYEASKAADIPSRVVLEWHEDADLRGDSPTCVVSVLDPGGTVRHVSTSHTERRYRAQVSRDLVALMRAIPEVRDLTVVGSLLHEDPSAEG